MYKTISILRRDLQALFAALGMLVCVSTAWAAVDVAAQPDCAAVLERSRFEPTPPANGEVVLVAQNCLREKGFPPVKYDGRLGPLTRAQLENYWKSLERPPAPRDGLGVAYSLTEADLQALQAGKAVLAAANKLKDQPFASQEALRQALAASLNKVGGAGGAYLQLLLRNVQRQAYYSLTEPMLNELRVQNVPEAGVKALMDIKGLGFPKRAALEKAIRTRTAAPETPAQGEVALESPTALPALDDAGVQSLVAKVDEAAGFVLTRDALAALAEDPLFNVDMAALAKPLAEMQDVEYPSQRLFRSALHARLGVALPEALVELIVRQARKVHAFNPAAAVKWNGDGCGCVRDALTRVTYGFSPFWQAGPERKVDFSFLSRIGYFALALDDAGKLANPLHWRADRADFINQARKHGSKVDLVIYKNDWSKWTRDIAAGDHSGIDRATANIVKALETPLDNTFFNRHKAVFSLGSSSTPRMGDGVTLYFEDYPTDEAASQYLLRFVKTLRKRLRAVDPNLFLNMVVPPEAIGNGLFTFKYLSQIVPDVADSSPVYAAQNDVDLFLVMLEEPTSSSKKELRQRIENRFTGAKLYRAIQRRNLLRKVVPVLMPDVGDARQFDEDVIYLQDNFGGVGLWPLPSRRDAGKDASAALANTVTQITLSGLEHFMQADAAKPPSMLDKLVCPNRWIFRIALDVLTFILVGFALLAIFLCQLRKFWERHSWYFLALTLIWVALALAILFHDPFYTSLARGNGPLILLVLANLLYLAYVVINRKRRTQQP